MKRTYLCLGLLLSTLIFPIQIAFVFLIFPPIYVSFIVPFLIWKFSLQGSIKNIDLVSLAWKLPFILWLSLLSMFLGEFLALSVFYFIPNNGIHFIIFGIVILLIRSITYILIIFIWQPSIYHFSNKLKKLTFICTLIFCISGTYILYKLSSPSSQESFDSYYMHYLQNEKVAEDKVSG